MSNRYLFLLAWCEGSDSASGEETKVHSQEDLIKQYWTNNPHVFAVEVIANNEHIASAFGYQKAFFEGYTANDSVSTIIHMDSDPMFRPVIPNMTIDAYINL